jgi:hypothetical protein
MTVFRSPSEKFENRNSVDEPLPPALPPDALTRREANSPASARLLVMTGGLAPGPPTQIWSPCFTKEITRGDLEASAIIARTSGGIEISLEARDTVLGDGGTRSGVVAS